MVDTIVDMAPVLADVDAVHHINHILVMDILAVDAEDMVDMEGFALAAVCQELRVPLFSVKYITDIIGQNSVEDWAAKLQHARAALTKFLDQTIGKSNSQ